MIAVLLATYNGEAYLSEQLDSILNQTYDDFRIFIHDDGSTDKTRTIIDGYMSSFPDRIIYIDGPVSGSSKNNFFFLLEMVEADYYMFSDQDDVWLPDKIEKNMSAILSIDSNNDSPLLVFSDIMVVNENLNVIDKSFMHYSQLDPNKLGFNWLVVENCAPGCSMMFNSKARLEALKYKCCSNPECIRMHDWWLMLVVSALGRIGYIDESLMLYRQHGNNSVGAGKDHGFNRILLKIWWVISFTHITKTKNRINRFVQQAIQLNALNLSDEANEIVSGLESFYKLNKIQRIRFFIRHRLYRTKRNIWQLICL